MEKVIMRMSGIVLVFASLLLAGCASNNDNVRHAPPIPPTPQAEARLAEPGSIWPGEGSRNNLFADNKARYVNDIVTIVVSEVTQGTSKASTNTSRDSSTTAGITGLLGLDKSLQAMNAKLNPSIQVGGSASNSLKGVGDTSRGSTFTTKITARVVKVMDNGNLAIEGWRQLKMNGESQYVVIRGIVRPDDITSDNLISSQYIADARIDYVGDGVINDKMKPGWLTKVVDYVWPF
ncbi:MAG: flagellar basal body L-ring protein FlgH [Syntrophales bacterium]|jgi:flagellar L-ring protein precursor FlgH|nr:flagellar basal body L-ring protein FlgH [Syntrophales bacterium]